VEARAEPTRRTHHLAGALPALLPLLLAAVVFAPILRNYFHADDFLHLHALTNGNPLSFLVQGNGGHMYLLRNALFLLSYRAFGPDPRWFFAMVLVTHLLNVWLLFDVARRLTDSGRIACLAATLWGTSPVNGATLGWYSVYGQVVLASLVLLALRVLARHLQAGTALRWRDATVCYALLLAGTTCFGTGIGFAIVFPLVVSLVLPPALLPRPVRRFLFSLPVVVVALYVVLLPLSARGTGLPPGTLQIFLLGRALGWEPLLMLIQLLAAGLVGLVASFWRLPGSSLGLVAYAGVAAIAAALAGTLPAAPPATRRLLVGLLLLTVAAYAMIALGRGVLHFQGIEPRYHYSASVPLVLVLALMLARAAHRVPLPARVADVGLAACLALGTLGYARNAWRIDHFEQDRLATARVLAAIRSAVDATPRGTAAKVANQFFPPVLALGDFPGSAGVFTIFFPSDELDGRRVYFVVRDTADLRWAVPGTRLARLLLPPASDSAAHPMTHAP
jgi:hypothetical protein